VAHRHGLAKAVDSGGGLAGGVPPDLPRRVGHAIGLYERFADHRPPGWPASAAALCALASQRRADVLAGDVARLTILAKGMQAASLVDDRGRVHRARERAIRRQRPRPGRLAFRITPRPRRVETSEQRRRRVRDAVLLLGGDPASWPNATLALQPVPIAPNAGDVELLGEDRCEELDGVGARATRYRDQLNRGIWRLR
jgi:hypothetical protein